jgi:microcystin-dependent protein
MPVDPFIGRVAIFAFTFAPRNWAACDGSVLQISQNTALFSLIQTFYGGNGMTTFALPEMRGRAPLNRDGGTLVQGNTGGQAAVALTVAQMPAHTHVAHATSAPQTTNRPGGALPSTGGAYAPSDGTLMDAEAIAIGGGGQPHENLPPYLVLNLCVALAGIFPPHS